MRTSPMHALHTRSETVWGRLNDMPVVRALGAASGGAVQLFDLSALRRTGLKGPQAAAWLTARNLPIPERANTWNKLGDSGLIARLGRSEFLLEDGPHDTSAAQLDEALTGNERGLYPVLRQDAALALRGEAASELLSQVCSIDLSASALEERAVALTMMAGISVVVMHVSHAQSAPIYRIWCDGTYGAYLWETLLEIAVELGGGAAGLSTLYPDVNLSGAHP